jgi:hypothetical protein
MKLQNRITDSGDRALLTEIMTFAKKVWEYPLLPGFTDHGIGHSQEVVSRIEEFLGEEEILRLSEDNAFVLLASCYLHDVCMQDYGILENRIPDRKCTKDVTWEERKIIRKSHGKRLYDLLDINNGNPELVVLNKDKISVKILLPDLGKYRLHISAVSYGHTTEGFKHISRKLHQSNSTHNSESHQIVFLAALLLIGDECDISNKRTSKILPHLATLDNESKLHTLKHHYVSESKIIIDTANPSRRKIFISYNWPKGIAVGNANYARDFKRWIECKIREQINLVHPALEFSSGISFDAMPFETNDNEVSVLQVMGFPRDADENETMGFLLSMESARIDTANYNPLIEKLSILLDNNLDNNHDNNHVFCLIEPKAGEYKAREVALMLMQKLLYGNPETAPKCVEIDFFKDRTLCSDPKALVEQITGPISDIPQGSDDESAIPGFYYNLICSLSGYIKTHEKYFAVLLANAQLCDENTRRFIIEKLIPETQNLGGKLAVFITSNDNTYNVWGVVSEKLCRIESVDLLNLLKRHAVINKDKEALITRAYPISNSYTQCEAVDCVNTFKGYE